MIAPFNLLFSTMRIKYLSLIAMTVILSGCATSAAQNGGTGSLQALKQITYQTTAGTQAVNINNIRFTALKQAAMTIGAQSGLSWRADQINQTLTMQEKQLDFAYNFYGLLLPHDIIPPVLAQGNDALNLADPLTIRIQEKIYKIESQARFVTAPPTWRDYLWMNYPQPSIPNSSLLPINNTERQVWRYYVTIGWKNGIQQANNIFDANLARLNRDYKGMILYRKLYEENMVSAPYVAKTDLGITGNANEMNIGDEVLRITALPALNLQGNTWKPAIAPTNPNQPVFISPPQQNNSQSANGDQENIWIK